MTHPLSNNVRRSKWGRWWRLEGVCGIAFFVLFIVGGVGQPRRPHEAQC